MRVVTWASREGTNSFPTAIAVDIRGRVHDFTGEKIPGVLDVISTRKVSDIRGEKAAVEYTLLVPSDVNFVTWLTPKACSAVTGLAMFLKIDPRESDYLGSISKALATNRDNFLTWAHFKNQVPERKA